MRRFFAVAITFVGLSFLSPVRLARAVPQSVDFQPVEAASVSAVMAPYNTITTGTVVLKILVSENGRVQDIKVQNAVASLTQSAVSSVRGWTFKPAMMDGTPVASSITVAAAFNTQCLFTAPSNALKLQAEPQPAAASGYQPVGVISANVSPCPYGATLLSASVVLQASIDASGNVARTRTLRDVPPYTAAAAQSLNGWKFAPAKFNGDPTESKVIVAFFFRQAGITPGRR